MLELVPFEGPPEEWDALGSGFADFTINQSWAWGEGRRADGWTVSRDLWRDAGGELVALATALRKRVRGMRLLYISRGPVVFRDGRSTEEAEAAFERCMAGYRAGLHWGEMLACVVYQSPDLVSPGTLRDSGLLPLFPPCGQYDFSAIVKLEQRDSLVQGASSDWRKLFRRSRELLEEIRSTQDESLFIDARDLVARLEASKGFTTTLTPALIRAVARTRRARLFYVEPEPGKIMAALLVVLCGRRASRFLAGVAPDEARSRPGIGRVLEVAASQWAFDSDVFEYDLEGISPRNPGVSDFKKGMRGEMFAMSGTHVASRPAVLAKAYSAAKRRPWSEAFSAFSVSKTYFAQVTLRRSSGRRLVWEKQRLYRRDLGDKVPVDDRPGYTVVWLDAFDRSEFRYRLSTVRNLWPAMEKLKPGELEACVILDKHGLAAAYGFMVWGQARIPEIDTVLSLEEGEVYLNDFYVVPDHRGQGLYPFILGKICARMRKRGMSAALIAANTANRPSCRGIERSGFSRHREARYRRIGPWRSLRWRSDPSAG
jgi:GNAT superfamily N-acetyltransferase